MTVPRFFSRLEGDRIQLDAEVALASWDKAGSSSQDHSAAFINCVYSSIAPRAEAIADPLGLRLDVGLPDSVALLALRDLDNYLFPLVPQLSARIGRQFASVWATKRHAATSSVTIGPAVQVADPPATYEFEVRTTASASTTAYKEQIRNQIASATPLPEGGIALQIAFVVGPSRAWPNLWKATIDALASILGQDPGADEWNPRDGRITDLGLHCSVDQSAHNDVTIAIRASAIPEHKQEARTTAR